MRIGERCYETRDSFYKDSQIIDTGGGNKAVKASKSLNKC